MQDISPAPDQANEPFADVHVDLASDTPRSARSEFVEALESLELGATGLGRLDALASRFDSDVETVALVLASALVFRHTRQETLPLGYQQESDFTIRLDYREPGAFDDLIARFRRAQDALEPCGEAAPNIVLRRSGCARPWLPADITFRLDRERGVIEARYHAGLFLRERIDEWLRQLAVLIEAAAAAPGTELDGHRLVTAAGLELLPDPTLPIDEPDQRPVTQTIVERCRLDGDAIAVVQQERKWSYAELDERSGRIARLLVHHGVRAERVVAVTGQRGFAFVASMLGVLRSGGVLLSLDPTLPEDRRRVMAAEAGAGLLVNIGDAGGEISDLFEHVIDVDPETGAAREGVEVGDVPLPEIDPHQSAYIFFTSGSTGVPKGVRGVHRGLAHFLDWQRGEFDIRPTDRASQLTALSFDVVMRDTFMILTAGGALCVPGEKDVLDPARILRWMEQTGVTVLHVVPSLARMWLNHVPEDVALRALKHVFFAGEPLLDQLVEKWRSRFGGGAEIVNLYGPTETTLAKCFKRIGAAPDPGVQSIGSPMPNTQVLILNPSGTQCGLYETGEICIRTPFRTLGYINNAEAAAKAFRSNPFTSDGDDIIYRTGDSGRYRGDGQLEILGRIDNQVKIRGVRIEPGEIEAVISRFPGVMECTVVALTDEASEKYLAAYVAPHPIGKTGTAFAMDDLRRHLREQLPENLVPSAFVQLDSLPLNPNGKVNKKALPAPDRNAFAGAAYVPPEDELQATLAEVWQELLGIDRVGIDDDFFDLGGHSLLAVQLVHRIGERLERTCTLTMLFRTRTIRLLADELNMGGAENSEAALLPLQPLGSGPPLFCIVGIHLYQPLADTLAPDIPVYGIFLPMEEKIFEDPEASKTASLSMEEMATGYLEAIRRHQANGPYMLAGVSFGGVLAFEIAHQLRGAGEEVAFLGILDSMLPDALRRNWLSWMRMHLNALASSGPGYLLEKLRHRLRGRNGRAEPEGAPDPAEAMASLRAELYRKAELAYHARPYDGPAVLVRASDKSWFGSDVADDTYGWGKRIENLALVDTPGGHLTMLEDPHVQALSRQLRPIIEKARSRAAS